MDEERRETSANTSKPNSNRRFMVIMLIVCLVGAVAGFYWWQVMQNRISTENAKVTTDISNISFQVGGQLEQLLVDEGEPVKKGQVLARLANEQHRIALEQAQAALEVAQANYDRLPFDLQSKDMQVEKARNQVAIAATQVRTAEVAMEDAHRLLDNNQQLNEAGAISEEVLATSRSGYAKAAAALEAARLSVQAAETGLRDTEQQRAAADKIQGPLMLAQLKQSQAAYQTAALNYQNSILCAPISGSVARLAVRPGETLSPGLTVISLVQPGNSWVTANIEEKKISRVKQGQKVEVRIDTYPGQVFQGRVATVGDVSQGTFALFSGENAAGNFTKVSQRVPVKISVDSRGFDLKPGTSAEVRIYTKE